MDYQGFILENTTPIPWTGCWLWDRTVDLRTYCVVGNTKSFPADYIHRVAYKAFVGPLEKGEEVHHRCGIKGCANPAHLEKMSGTVHRRLHAAERLLPTHCRKGHEFTPENTAWVHGGKHRECRICQADAKWERLVRRL